MSREKFNITSYCDLMENYLGNQDGEAKDFWRALSFAVSAHAGQKRKSGEAYVSHPCHVARILVEELGVKNPETLAAAILHDTVEDVPEVTNEVIGELFGKEIEAIVDGCTKIANFSGDRQTFHKLVHRKIFTGAAARVEVMLIKLADRLHNLRTMNSMPKHKRQKIAEETLSVYAPMAKVLGLFQLKRELYDLALVYKFPRQSIKVLKHTRQEEAEPGGLAIKRTLEEEMERAWISGEVEVRAKGLWAYYDPQQKTLIRELETPVEIIVTVNDIQSCYRALGLTNQSYPPIPRTIRDFIANPKPTGYQSLHARANIKGRNYLFKFRTPEMLLAGRIGIIKEWQTLKKMPSSFEQDIQEMLGILGSAEGIDYQEMIAVSGKKEIYTYTPKGDCFCLPKESTILDFAFKVHTDVGKRCISGVVGPNKFKPDHILQDGDRVEIVCQEALVNFEPEMLTLCQTPKARADLSKMFRARRTVVAKEVGRSLLQQELKRYGIPAELIQSGPQPLLEKFEALDLDELFVLVGEGQIRLRELVREIRDTLYVGHETLQPPVGALNRIFLATLDPVCIKLARCCNPVPVNKGLYGLLSERGMSVHNMDCKKLMALTLQREDVVEVRWQLKETRIQKRQTLVIPRATNRNRVLMMLGVAPEEMRILEVVALAPLPSGTAAWEINFEVDTLQSLKNILNHFNKTGIDYEFVLDQ